MNTFELDLALGRKDGVSSFGRFGYNSAITAEETIWTLGGTYTFPPAATAMTVSSSSTADDFGSTGATTISITALDSDYNQFTITKTLDGRTGVAIGTDIIRVIRARVLTAGSGGTNAGIIYIGSGTVTTGVPANKYTSIAAGDGQTNQCFYTVPANKRAFMVGYYVTAGKAAQTITYELFARPFGEVFTVREHITAKEGAVYRKYDTYREYFPKTDLMFNGTPDGGTVDVSAGFDLLLVDE